MLFNVFDPMYEFNRKFCALNYIYYVSNRSTELPVELNCDESIFKKSKHAKNVLFCVGLGRL